MYKDDENHKNIYYLRIVTKFVMYSARVPLLLFFSTRMAVRDDRNPGRNTVDR